MGAARVWALGSAGNEVEKEAVADARRFGFSEADQDKVRIAAAGPDQDDFDGVWADHVDTVAAFLLVSTQWRTGFVGNGSQMRPVYLGLDYAGAIAGIEAAGLVITADLWAGVRTMEHAARDALNT